MRWPQPIGDSQRQGPVADVAGGAQHVRRAEESAIVPYAARVLSNTCAATAVSAAKVMPTPASRGAEQKRAGDRQPGPGGRREHQQSHRQVGQTGQRERRGQRGPPADPGGAEQFGPPGLLVGAGVPADQEHVHQRDHDRHEREDLEDDLAADGLQQPGRPAHRDDRRVAAEARP